ncbi:TsoY family (seleno)protein [Profundibacter sp.]
MRIAPTRPSESYSPIYFLASLGAGGLSTTFFMFLLFWVPHIDRPVPVFEDIMAAFGSGDLMMRAMIIAAMAGIAVMTFMNIRMLIWNLMAFSKFSKTQAYTELKNSNAETTILAMPLAIAMTINVAFINGLVFVPGLWGVIEYLFPLAIIAFSLVGWLAFRFIGDFLGRVLTKGGMFDVTAHNSFSQLLPAFALSMVAVGMAAPAAMSHVPTTIGISLILSTFVGITALVYALFAAFTAFNSMLHYGTAKESSPTLMIVIPIITVLGIMLLRQNHGLHVQYDAHSTAGDNLMLFAKLLSVQILFLALGLLVLKREAYFKDFVFGDKTSPGSYALVCPGVALSVMLQFFINVGLVQAGLVEKFSIAYWGLTAIAIGFQVAMLLLVFRLNKQHFGKPKLL